MATIAKIIGSAVVNLNPRQREVLYGPIWACRGGRRLETLAAIGDRLNVTRVGVRQIQNSAMAVAKANVLKNEEAVAVLAKVSKYIAGKGGVAGKADVVTFAGTLAKGIRETQLDFLAEASGAFQARREDDEFLPLYASSDKEWKTAKSFVDGWVGTLRSRQENVFSGSYRTELASFVKNKAVAGPIAENYLGLSKQIGVNPYGDFGLQEWPEINPKTVRDKILHLVLKKGEPLHFEGIAKHINDVGFDGQEALAHGPQRLRIKDNRFVLVGRGMYGLREQGYEPGIAREVIMKVLKEKGPMHAKDVVAHVTKQRFFKPNTIVINLQNKNLFQHLPDGKYQVREA